MITISDIGKILKELNTGELYEIISYDFTNTDYPVTIKKISTLDNINHMITADMRYYMNGTVMYEFYNGPLIKEELKSSSQITCTCSSRDLLNKGCTCGAFQREKELRNEKK